MTVQSRQTKVLAALLVSIVLCTIILNILGHNPPSAGAFCLSQYNQLDPIEKVIHSADFIRPGYFKWIEIYCSKGSSINRVASASNMQAEQSISDVSDLEDINCHFIIYNGNDESDGEIKPTENWRKQLPVKPRSDHNIRRAWQCEQTVYICIIMDGKSAQPTNFQIKRLYVLVKELCRELNIKSDSVIYPNNWQY